MWKNETRRLKRNLPSIVRYTWFLVLLNFYSQCDIKCTKYISHYKFRNSIMKSIEVYRMWYWIIKMISILMLEKKKLCNIIIDSPKVRLNFKAHIKSELVHDLSNGEGVDVIRCMAWFWHSLALAGIWRSSQS